MKQHHWIYSRFLLIFLIFAAAFCQSGCSKEKAPDTSGQTNESLSAEISDDTDVPSEADLIYTLSIPDDFSLSEAEGTEFCYVAQDGSSITLNIQPRDPSFDSLNADSLYQALTDAFVQLYGKDFTFTEFDYGTDTVSGYPAYHCRISWYSEETPVTQLITGIDTGLTCTFTFTDLSGSYLEDFEESISTISLRMQTSTAVSPEGES